MKLFLTLGITLSTLLLTLHLTLILLLTPTVFQSLYQQNSLPTQSESTQFAHQVATSVFDANLIISSTIPLCSPDRRCFTSAEMSHLEDVRNFYHILVQAMLLAISGSLLLIVISRATVTTVRAIMQRMVIVLIVFVLIIGGIGFWQWNSFFVFFHQLFFPQGNWSFSADSLLITLYPPEFWQLFAAIFAILLLVSFCILSLISKLLTPVPSSQSSSSAPS